MSRYSAIKAATNAYIKTNGRREITGNILNAVMMATINSLGKYYQFVGVATPEIDPGEPDENVAYLASTAGIYPDFGGASLSIGEIAVLKWDGEWHKHPVIIIPTKVSQLVNDLGFITNAVSDLINYYTKDEIDASIGGIYTKTEVQGILLNYYDKAEVDAIVDSITGQSFVLSWDGTAEPIVSDIPAGVVVSYGGTPYTGTLVASADTLGKIYLVKNGADYDMYVTTDNSGYAWIQLGSTSIDLSGYATQDEVDDLREGLGEMSSSYKEMDISAIALGYYDLSGATAPSTPSASTQTSSVQLDAKPGRAYKIYGYGGTNARLYAFIDSSRNILDVAVADLDARETPVSVIAPAGTAKLIYQSVNYDVSRDKVEVYAKTSVASILESGATETEWAATLQPLTADKYYVINPNNTYITASATNGTGYYCTRIVVSPGDVFRITGKGGATTHRMWATAKSDRRYMRTASSTAIDMRSNPQMITIEADEYYLYINLEQYDPITDKVEKLTSTQETTPGLIQRVDDLEQIAQPAVDSLDSTSTTAPLSANQGRVLNDGLQTKVPIKLGRNLFDANAPDITEGKYLSSDGSVLTSASKNISGYIPVEAETGYYLSADGGVGVNVNYRAFYDADGNYISSQYQQNSSRAFVTPSGCAFVRFTYYPTTEKIMLEKGSSRSKYEEYSIIGGYYPAIKEGQLVYADFSDGLKDIVKMRFDSFRGEGTLAPGESLTLSTTYCKKDVAFVAHIDGTIESVVMGVGGTALTAYLGYYITLTPTTIVVKRMDTGSTPASASHGLTLTQHTTIVVETDVKDKASVANNDVLKVTITIYDNLGNSFSLDCDNYWGYGTPFFTNGNTSFAVDVSLSFFPKSNENRVWVFGDSYWEFTYLQKRPPYWLFVNGHRNFLLCAKGGMSQEDQLVALNNLLSTGFKPSFIFWMLGMNDSNDTIEGDDIIVNPSAKARLDTFISICEDNGIIPILATTPTVPTRQHSGLSDYVRSLGYRYVDVAKAVGCDTDGNWYTGLLGDDGVHPTSAGSKVIYSQILLDFPEITHSI